MWFFGRRPPVKKVVFTCKNNCFDKNADLLILPLQKEKNFFPASRISGGNDHWFVVNVYSVLF